MELLSHPFAGIRQATVSTMEQFHYVVPEVVDKLVDLLSDNDSDVRSLATKALKQLGNRHTAVLHRLSVVLEKMSGSAPLSDAYVLKDLDKQRKETQPTYHNKAVKSCKKPWQRLHVPRRDVVWLPR